MALTGTADLALVSTSDPSHPGCTPGQRAGPRRTAPGVAILSESTAARDALLEHARVDFAGPAR
jgi:hypothetical protein